MSAPRIAIIGGGPGGLTLLNVLARHGVSATLYERDDSAASRSHLGGMLDLHEESGQAALRGAELYAEFEKKARPEGQELIVTDRTGEPLLHWKPAPDAEAPPGARPEIDRRDLRQLLIDGAPAGSIKYGHAFVSARPIEGSHEWEVSFANGKTVVVDLLVGADGARSRVRPLVSPAQPIYTGLQILETAFEARDQPALAARCGGGSVFAFDEGKLLGAQVNGGGHVRVYGYFRAPEDYAVPREPEAAISALLKHFDGWAPWLRELVAVADRSSIYQRALHELPAGHSWPHRRGVTLLGDAMNLMTNFAGKGANTAMWDALELGKNIASACKDGYEGNLDLAVAEYEERMCVVAGKAAQESHDNMVMSMGENGAAKFIAMATGAVPT
ncbi:monooxygenase FAD-binding protein [Auricularia subglabra TFB-10046 SS5]|nr:monooxygenase FAD-binding protein [Auricularia subglabra TFB-10046 SS5]